MNYLTMCDNSCIPREDGRVDTSCNPRGDGRDDTPCTPRGDGSGDSHHHGLAKLDTNIYSIPLFYNEFYENSDSIAGASNGYIPDNIHHHCNKSVTDSEPQPCGTSRYITDNLKRHVTCNRDASRDSGTGSINRNSDVSTFTEFTDIERNVYVNDVPIEKTDNKCCCTKVMTALLIGVALGVIACSVLWLTIDKFNSESLNCVLQNSLTGDKQDEHSTTTRDPKLVKNPTPESQQNVSIENGTPNSHEATVMTTDSTLSSQNTHTDAEAASNNPSSSMTNATLTTESISTHLSDGQLSNTTTDMIPSSDSLTSTQVASQTPTDRHTEPTESTIAPPIIDSTSDQTEPIMNTDSTVSPPSSSDTLPVTPYITTDVPGDSSPDISSTNPAPVSAGLSFTTTEPVSAAGGFVYVRWGRHDCPDTSHFLYSGFAGGGHYVHSGGAASNLCLPDAPTWGRFNDALEADRNLIHVTEYESSNTAFNTLMGKSLHNENVPCAVCQASGRFAHVMIPGRVSCLADWNQEYTGYLMGGSFEHPHGKSVICVDIDSHPIPGRSANENGNLLYFVEFRGTNTDNYVNGRELACTVCTR